MLPLHQIEPMLDWVRAFMARTGMEIEERPLPSLNIVQHHELDGAYNWMTNSIHWDGSSDILVHELVHSQQPVELLVGPYIRPETCYQAYREQEVEKQAFFAQAAWEHRQEEWFYPLLDVAGHTWCASLFTDFTRALTTGKVKGLPKGAKALVRKFAV